MVVPTVFAYRIDCGADLVDAIRLCVVRLCVDFEITPSDGAATDVIMTDSAWESY